MCNRKNPNSRPSRDAKPDLPFSEQRAYRDLDPREKWSPLRLKMWRSQQNVAARLRKAVRKLRDQVDIVGDILSGKEGLAFLQSSGNGRRGHRFDRLVSLTGEYLGRERQLGVPHFVYAAYRARLTRVFEPTTASTVGNNEHTGLTRYKDEVLHSTWVNRARQTARGYWESLVARVSGTVSVVLGHTCAVCGGDHSTISCYSAYQSTLNRCTELVVIARTRSEEVSQTLALQDQENPETALADDLTRIAGLVGQMELAARSRKIGMAWWARRAATHGLKSLGLGVPYLLLGVVNVADDFWYIATGERFSLVTRANNWIESVMFPTSGLLEFYEQEVSRLNQEVNVLRLEAEAARESVRLRAIAEREIEFSTLGSIGLIDDWDQSDLALVHARRKKVAVERVFLRRFGEMRTQFIALVTLLGAVLRAWARGKKYPAGPISEYTSAYGWVGVREWLRTSKESAVWDPPTVLRGQSVAMWLFCWAKELESDSLTDDYTWGIVSASDIVAEFLDLMDRFRYNVKGDFSWFAANTSAHVFRYELPLVEKIADAAIGYNRYGRVLRTAGVAVEELLD